MLSYLVRAVVQGIRDNLYTQEEPSGQYGRDRNGSKVETRSFTGRITQYDRTTSSGMIDNSVYFDIAVVIGQTKPQIGVTAHVQASRQHSLAGWIATEVHLINQWQPETESTIRNVVGYVSDEGRTSCVVLCGDEEIVFNRDSVSSDYYSRLGDWVKLRLLEQDDVEIVAQIEPLRQKQVTGVINYFSSRSGIIEDDIGFVLSSCQSGYTPRANDTVTVDCIECKHPKMSWRALKVCPINFPISNNSAEQPPCVGLADRKEERFGIKVSGQGEFGETELSKSSSVIFIVKNQSDIEHTLISCKPVSLKDQLTISLNQETKDVSNIPLKPGDTIELVVELIPKQVVDSSAYHCQYSVLGRLVTAVVFDFGKFRMSRSVKANTVDSQMRILEPTQPFRFQRRSGSMEVKYQDRLKACSVPGQRPMRKRAIRLPHILKNYFVPDNIRECIELQEDITFVHPNLLEPLTWETYQEYFSTLLHCEEIQIEQNMRQFDMKSASMYPRGPYLSLGVPGLAEGRPSLLVGDRVIVCEPGGDERFEHFEGYIHEVHGGNVLIKFAETFHSHFCNEEYDVMFTFSRTPLRRMHQSVELIPQLGRKTLFPTSPSAVPPLLRTTLAPSSFFNTRLNDRQKVAVVRILGAQGRPAPYVVFGPPGTGKTVTLVEAILQVYHLNGGNCRILACAPSNSAADLIAERLLLSGCLQPGDLVRLNALQRGQPPSELLLPHCMDTNDVDTAARHRLVICTCVTSGILYNLSLPIGHFTNVFVDEAGQATEPECLIPLCLLSGTDRQPVLAGDPHQLGPVLQSRLALSHGLDISLLERLMCREAYQRDETKYSDHGCYDPLLVTKLIANYRSHKSLLRLYSQIFYDNELVSAADDSLTHSLLDWRGLPTSGFPLLFHGVIGEDVQEGDSPSWFNPVEAVQVVRYTQCLLSECHSLTTTDIGIITPYRKQVEKIRLLLQRTGLEDIKVGSVEEFQGQEKHAIIMSTVRSTSNHLSFDLVHNLGFLSNPKRFNVSVSRAQALLVVVGNPILLKTDQYWSQLVDYAVSNGAYTGCPLSNEIDSST